MCNRTLPDFKALADTVTERADIAELLATVYHQGYSAGHLDADTESWVEVWDDEYKNA